MRQTFFDLNRVIWCGLICTGTLKIDIGGEKDHYRYRYIYIHMEPANLGNVRAPELPKDGRKWKKYGQKFIRNIGKFRYMYSECLSACIRIYYIYICTYMDAALNFCNSVDPGAISDAKDPTAMQRSKPSGLPRSRVISGLFTKGSTPTDQVLPPVQVQAPPKALPQPTPTATTCLIKCLGTSCNLRLTPARPDASETIWQETFTCSQPSLNTSIYIYIYSL